MNKEIVITDVIDLEVAFVKQEKKKAVSDKLAELWEKVNDSLLTNVFLSGEETYDTLDDLKQLFTEAGMK